MKMTAQRGRVFDRVAATIFYEDCLHNAEQHGFYVANVDCKPARKLWAGVLGGGQDS